MTTTVVRRNMQQRKIYVLCSSWKSKLVWCYLYSF